LLIQTPKNNSNNRCKENGHATQGEIVRKGGDESWTGGVFRKENVSLDISLFLNTL
jgi:hypothetical protein